MYPFLRAMREVARAGRSGPLELTGRHVSHHRCWPWDLDPWLELNNGRTLTLFDLGRLPLLHRTGLLRLIRARGWGFAMAGASVRWRRRVRAFDAFEMHTRIVSWDARFFHIEQTMWRGGEATSSALYRAAVTGPDGILPPVEVTTALGHETPPPPLPAWIVAWSEAEAARPWPPEG
ncbi:MAG: acyl-CoA thioesterase [Rhodobacteraceae bacterium]|jgi:acyl-CoA thioesterase FadM|nr:acyl-CoA thioesterase [Paracoccaceae bacterium]